MSKNLRAESTSGLCVASYISENDRSIVKTLRECSSLNRCSLTNTAIHDQYNKIWFLLIWRKNEKRPCLLAPTKNENENENKIYAENAPLFSQIGTFLQTTKYTVYGGYWCLQLWDHDSHS